MDKEDEIKDYEMALSYAHNDLDVARAIKEELEVLFADRFFMDEHKPEELANATQFKEKLRNIFERSNYSIILYSDNYENGRFTGVERSAILNKEKKENRDNPHFFIINIDSCEVCGQLHGYTYIALKVSERKKDGTESEHNELRDEIHGIIHNKIKMCMINQTFEEKKRQNKYSLNIQTLFASGNCALWKMDYDWNLSARAYIGEDGRKIKEGFEWSDLWEYVEKDFVLIKGKVKQEPDTQFILRLNCHLSVAYKLGEVYGDLWQASGNRNLVLVSSNRVGDIVFVFDKEIDFIYPENFCKGYEGNDDKSQDIVCIISIKPWEQGNILKTVKEFLEKNGQKYSKICLFKKEMKIEDTKTLEGMAKYLREKMISCRTGSNCTIHLFADTTAPLMFALGAKSIFPGKVQLYEYISGEDIYVKSLAR